MTRDSKSQIPNPKSTSPTVSGILQRTAVRTISERTVQPIEETQTFRESHFQHDFSAVPVNTAAASIIQPKLKIGAVGDKYEQEADRVARQVVNQMNAPGGEAIEREEKPEDDEKLQMKPMVQRQAAGYAMAATPEVETSIQSAKGSGQPLASNIRKPMEQAFGADFSRVKVHTDAQSDQLNQSIQAKAFTTGENIFFRRGEYNPGSQGGKELIAHELTHVVQQSTSAVQRKTEQKSATNLDQQPQENKLITTQQQSETIQRAIGMEIEIPVPIDQLTGGQIAQIRNEVVAEQAAGNNATKMQHKLAAKNIRDQNGRIAYGTIRGANGGFRVDADHDDRVMTPNPYNSGWPLPEGGRDSIMEIVMDPPAVDITAFNNTMDNIDQFINQINAQTNNLTSRWNSAFGNVSVGPMNYAVLGFPAMRQPNHNFQGSVQVNIGIDLREYHSLIKWYVNSDYAKANNAPANEQALYRQIKTDIRQAVNIGRTIIQNIYAGMTPLQRQQAGNLRGLRGWITHLALYLKRGTIGLGVLGGTAKNIAPILLKSPNDVVALYGMTPGESTYFTLNRNTIMDQIFQMTGRVGNVGQPLNAVDAFAANPNHINADVLSDLTSGLNDVPLTGKPIQEATGVGPQRTGNPSVQGLPNVPVNDLVTGNPTVGGGANTRGGMILEFRTLPGYYNGSTSWRALGLKFLQEAIARNTRSGIGT
ncbi:MAG: DUF4157 domain-containing protein [Cyanomargarita calcarea GSE-NOS-MK-12-04C]|jgi:hypothetical protein|uniref:DUF4157 domain-containing protein n=1 Tax=Cyanomargarita calcarea GSE-NOS-MK-12-04C TaxID=2839659 RepID=A0A951QRK4_9CYAN|nr:DUF4157 domain-containing protein [Cyanomargarita calcarea GSE-NOS-MK-12-04C]